MRGVCKGYMCTCVHVWECMCAYGVVSVSDACVGSVCVVRERRLIVKLHLLFALTCEERGEVL